LKKIFKSRRNKPLPPDNCAPLGELYFDYKEFKEKEIFPKEFIPELAHKLLKWAAIDGNEEKGIPPSLRISSFRIACGIGKRTWEEWAVRWPLLATAIEEAKEMIAARREFGALSFKYNATTVKETIGFYCDISRSEQERLAKLKDAQSMNQGNITIVLDGVPRTAELDKHEERKAKK